MYNIKTENISNSFIYKPVSVHIQ